MFDPDSIAGAVTSPMPKLLEERLIPTPTYTFKGHEISGWIRVRRFPKNSTVKWDIGSIDNYHETSTPLGWISDADESQNEHSKYFWYICREFMAPPRLQRGLFSFRWGMLKVPTEDVDEFLAAFQPFWLGRIDTKLKEVCK